MKIYCTYCSADKDHCIDEIPAIERYKSKRISSAHNEANELGINFYILSGKLGLLASHEPIEYYDYLLEDNGVESHVNKVAKQLSDFGVTEIVFYQRSIEEDNNIQAYLDCIKMAADKRGIGIKFVEYSD